MKIEGAVPPEWEVERASHAWIVRDYYVVPNCAGARAYLSSCARAPAPEEPKISEMCPKMG